MTQHADDDETERDENATGEAAASAGDQQGNDGDRPPGPDAEPVYNDRDKLDFDPDEGLYTGTAVTGDTAIPGEHERVDDVPMDEDGNATDAKDADSDADDDD